MANLKNIQRKIKSVQNTGKITKAMKLVSTAKLKKAETLAKNSKEYAAKLNQVLGKIACNINHFEISGFGYNERYFKRSENESVVDIIFITADKGLCGGFNGQTIKKVRTLYAELASEGKKVRLRAVGRKGIDNFKFGKFELEDSSIGVSSAPSYEKAQAVIEKAYADFRDGKTDRVIIVYNGYKNMITQEIRTIDLLPIDVGSLDINSCESIISTEPDENSVLLESLLKKYIEFNLYYALIDSLAAEHSARVQAMDSANKNAKEMVNSLTISYNKARQESITTELIEIISGMEALK